MTAWHGYGRHFQAHANTVFHRDTFNTFREEISNPLDSEILVTRARQHILHSKMGRRFRILRFRRSLKLLCCLFLLIILLSYVLLLNGGREENPYAGIRLIELTNFEYDQTDIWNEDEAKQQYFTKPDKYEAQRSCKIPHIYPFQELALDLIIRNFEKKNLGQPKCLQTLPWFKTNLYSKLIRLEETSKHWYKMDCHYFPFELSDNNRISIPVEEPIPFKDHHDEFPIPDMYENIVVQCTHKDGGKLAYNGYFNFFRRNETLETETEFQETKSTDDSLSVIYLGMSGVSLTNFQRFLPKSRNFLLRNLSAIEFTGLNSVGQNQLIPILSGCNFKHGKPVYSNKSNQCQPIWKMYSKHGYVTVQSEEQLDIKRLEMDYDNQAFLTGIHSTSINAMTSLGCFEYQFMPNHIRDRIVEVAGKLSDKPYFHHAWTAVSSSSEIGYAKYLDNPIYEMLQMLKEKNLLNTTLLILNSDHGIVSSDYSRSADGLVESRNPLLYMVFPDWFKAKYSKAFRNMMQNSNGLITPYDLHSTLKDLLNMKLLVTNAALKTRLPNIHEPGTSLFLPIPLNRTCKSAHIPEDYCICKVSTQINNTNDMQDINLITALSYTLNYMNRELGSYEQCYKLDLAKFIDGNTRRNYNGQMLYEITFQVLPSHGIFNAVLKPEFLSTREDSKFSFISNIERQNDYGNQSSCLGFPWNRIGWIRSVCYCKELIQN